MIEKKVLVKDIEVNYKVFGEGKPPSESVNEVKPLLVLHGWGSKSERWTKVAELLTQIPSEDSSELKLMQKGMQIIVPDLPGFGLTPEPSTAWNLDNYVDFLYEFSEKVPELGREFYLLGHSFGGSVAVKFTIKYNQKIKKLFLISAACVRKVKLSKKILYRLAKIAKVFSFIPGYALLRKAIYKFVLRKSDYPYVKEGIMKETYLKVVSEDLSWRMPFIKVPTVIVWGSKDTSTPLAEAQIVNQKIRNSKLIVVPDAKHSLQLEVPEILAQKIAENIDGELLSLKNIV